MKHILLIEKGPLDYISAGIGSLDDMVRLGINEYQDKKWSIMQPVHIHIPFDSSKQQSKSK